MPSRRAEKAKLAVALAPVAGWVALQALHVSRLFPIVSERELLLGGILVPAAGVAAWALLSWRERRQAPGNL